MAFLCVPTHRIFPSQPAGSDTRMLSGKASCLQVLTPTETFRTERFGAASRGVELEELWLSVGHIVCEILLLDGGEVS